MRRTPTLLSCLPTAYRLSVHTGNLFHAPRYYNFFNNLTAPGPIVEVIPKPCTPSQERRSRCWVLIEPKCMCAVGKTFKKPRRPYEKERLDAELKLVGEYGLRNKRELWRVQMALSKIRKAARTLLTLDSKVGSLSAICQRLAII